MPSIKIEETDSDYSKILPYSDQGLLRSIRHRNLKVASSDVIPATIYQQSQLNKDNKNFQSPVTPTEEYVRSGSFNNEQPKSFNNVQISPTNHLSVSVVCTLLPTVVTGLISAHTLYVLSIRR